MDRATGRFEAVVVLDCAQVRTPDEFWEANSGRFAISPSGRFGRNLDALWDALAGGGPGWPGNVEIEVHHIEALEAAGHQPFVAALERIGMDLEEESW